MLNRRGFVGSLIGLVGALLLPRKAKAKAKYVSGGGYVFLAKHIATLPLFLCDHWKKAKEATPLYDIRRVQLFLAKERGCRIGYSGRLLMNSQTFAWFRDNLNPADLFGRRTCGLYHNVPGISQILQGDDLPPIVIDPKRPDGEVVFCGRDSEPVSDEDCLAGKHWQAMLYV